MKRNSNQLTARLVELHNAIKRKYLEFKEGAEASDILLDKQYKPIVTELRKNTPKQELKQEPKEEEDLTDDDDYERGFIPQNVSTLARSIIATPSGHTEALQYVDKLFKHPLTNEYMKLVLKDRGRLIDHTFGPRYSVDKLMVGNKPLTFDDYANIILGDVSYGHSKGLYELLFKRSPYKKEYNNHDLTTYKSIPIATSAHKRGYEFHGGINKNNSTHFKRVIGQLFPAEGKGMLWKSTKPRDIVHWDDPNKLIDRLRHLTMSTEAGNGGHSNEIINIVEELREAGYIKGSGNGRFRSLLE